MNRRDFTPPRERRLAVGFYNPADPDEPPLLFWRESYPDTPEGRRLLALALASFVGNLASDHFQTASAGVFEVPFRRPCVDENRFRRCGRDTRRTV